jgi:PAS domain S-box-containing protein
MSDQAASLSRRLPRGAVPAVACALFAGLTALRLLTGTDLGDGIMLLFAVPIALLALEYGPVGGAVAAGFTMAVFAAWVAVVDVEVSAVGYLTRSVTCLLVGVLVGGLARQRTRIAEANARWFAMSNDLLCETSLDGRFTRCNDQWERVLGWTRQELISRPQVDFMHPGDAEVFAAASAGTLRDGAIEIVGLEIRFRAKDGSWRWLLWSARSDQARVYAIAKDITERKRLEVQLLEARKLESLGMIAGGIAHDFNNLLTTIVGNVAFARLEIDGGPGAAELDEIEACSERAARLTARLLAYARRQTLRTALLDLGEMVESASPALRDLLGREIELRLLIGRGLRPVQADRERIEQALLDLAANARDAMPSGGRLSIEVSQATPAELAIRVIDTGTGMDADTLAHAFDPFFTTKGTAPGLGLGLSTVQGVVSQSGGRVRAESEPGAGTTVEIRLPAAVQLDTLETGPLRESHR